MAARTGAGPRARGVWSSRPPSETTTALEGTRDGWSWILVLDEQCGVARRAGRACGECVNLSSPAAYPPRARPWDVRVELFGFISHYKTNEKGQWPRPLVRNYYHSHAVDSRPAARPWPSLSIAFQSLPLPSIRLRVGARCPSCLGQLFPNSCI